MQCTPGEHCNDVDDLSLLYGLCTAARYELVKHLRAEDKTSSGMLMKSR